MLDKHLHPRLKPGLNQLAAALDKPFITPDGLTLAGFAIGVLALPFLALGWYPAALIAIVLNRLLDGLDGALARRRGLTDAGGFLDIALDFLFYALLWREGNDFPPSPARMDTLLASGSLNLSLTFNPAHAMQKVASGELPADSYSFGFLKGMIGNVHFVAIPANASASAGAKVVANFLLSPQAQIRKANPDVWGDPSVLDGEKLPAKAAKQLRAFTPSGTPDVLPEPHAAWVNALEQEWLRRYGTR